MRQETGSNLTATADKVSIQLALDGHSFSVVGLPDDGRNAASVKTADAAAYASCAGVHGRTTAEKGSAPAATAAKSAKGIGSTNSASGATTATGTGSPNFDAGAAATTGNFGTETAVTSGADAEGAAERRTLCIEILTPRTILVPAELFAPEQAAGLLAAAGLPPRKGEAVVWSAPRQNAVAVMAVADDAVRRVEAYAKEAVRGTEASGAHPLEISYTTPLLEPVATDGTPTVWCDRQGMLLYIKVYDDGLRLAEAFVTPGDDDLLYVLERLEKVFRFRDCTLRLAGERQRETRRLLQKRFKEIICVS